MRPSSSPIATVVFWQRSKTRPLPIMYYYNLKTRCELERNLILDSERASKIHRLKMHFLEVHLWKYRSYIDQKCVFYLTILVNFTSLPLLKLFLHDSSFIA